MIEDLIKEYRRRRILRDIKKAKRYFEKREADYMCYSFMLVSFKYYNPINSIIPEFNREFLNAKYERSIVWWDVNDRESRIKAFDKLIEVYSKK
jgi:hypothetical protein